ncbi:hypothetical protein [Vulcanisaeta sp. JCM 14467]
MPSKAIGMGMCPRCGRPGTVVIKAGNYVYIKHGNTWHYIGTIDKVNLNKILIKNEKKEEVINYKESRYLIAKNSKRISIMLILLILAVFSLLTLLMIFYHSNYDKGNDIKEYIYNKNYLHVYTNISNTVTLIDCHIINVGNNVYQVICGNITYNAYQNNVSIKYINNLNMLKNNTTNS